MIYMKISLAAILELAVDYTTKPIHEVPTTRIYIEGIDNIDDQHRNIVTVYIDHEILSNPEEFGKIIGVFGDIELDTETDNICAEENELMITFVGTAKFTYRHMRFLQKNCVGKITDFKNGTLWTSFLMKEVV